MIGNDLAARHRRRHLRQGRPVGAGRGRPADAPHRRADGGRDGVARAGRDSRGASPGGWPLFRWGGPTRPPAGRFARPLPARRPRAYSLEAKQLGPSAVRSRKRMSAVASVDVPRTNVRIALRVNGEEFDAVVAPYKTLLEVLREDLALTGTKHGCELGECGACAVLVDGEPVLACLVLALECEGRAIDTVEGLARGAELHPLQAAFADLGAAQCGYCTPGILMTAKALLENEPDAEPRAHQGGAVRQPLPLHRVPADLRGGRGGRCGSMQGSAMSRTPAEAVRRSSASRAAASTAARRSPGRRASPTTSRCRACCTASSLRSPVPHAAIESIDVVPRRRASRRAPGPDGQGVPDRVRHPAGDPGRIPARVRTACATSATRWRRSSRRTSGPRSKRST